MKSAVAFLRDRKQRDGTAPSASVAPASSTPSSASGRYRDLQLPEPAELADQDYIRRLAGTRQSALVERRGEVRKYHHHKGRDIFRSYVAGLRAHLESLETRLTDIARLLEDRSRALKRFERFSQAQRKKKSSVAQEKEPATIWVYAKFVFLVVAMFAVMISGVYTVSSVMLDSTAFAGAPIKSMLVGIGIFLLPSTGLYVPFFVMMKLLPRMAYAYLIVLVCMGCAFFGLFIFTWAHVYALETGNEMLIDLTSIGVETITPDAEAAKPWLLREANWLTLIFQFMSDTTFAACMKALMDLMSKHYDLFRRRAFQQDPEWIALDQEVRDLTHQKSDLEGEKRRTKEHLLELTQRQEEYIDDVCAYADMLFQHEIDQTHQEEERIRQKQKDLEEKEAAWRTSQAELDTLLTNHPGLTRETTEGDLS